MRKARVTGEICLPVDARVNAKSLVRVQLLDTSLADAPALEVACQKIIAQGQFRPRTSPLL